jgi:hypothetical protein
VQLPVILGLAVLWAIVLAPDILRRRHTRRSADSITTFSRHLSMLERTNSGRPASRSVGSFAAPAARRRPTGTPTFGPAHMGTVVEFSPRAGRPAPAQRPVRTAADRRAPRPAPRTSAAQRRQEVIVGLGAAALLSLLAMLAFGGVMLILHLVIDVALIAYLALALQVSRTERSASRVAYLPQQRSPQTAMLPVSRVASR